MQIKLRYLPTGSYLRPHDMLWSVENTDFSEEEIIGWFKRFRWVLNFPSPLLRLDKCDAWGVTVPVESWLGHISEIWSGNFFLRVSWYLACQHGRILAQYPQEMQRILWSIFSEFLTLMGMTSWILRSSSWPWIFPTARQVRQPFLSPP